MGTSDQLQPGQMVDHYKVRQLVGRGGMGAVYLARDTRLGRKVALKVIHPHRLGARAVADFLEEARVTARFSHPHIVAVYGAGEIEGRPYLALEYLEGRNLRQQLAEARLPVGRAVRVAFAVAQALAEAHDAGVVHRDLKPENIFLPRDGHVRVLDFGLARAAQRDPEDPDAPSTSSLAGTPLYMAPEQWRDRTSASPSDVWAFGLCLYEMLTGHHPFADPGDTNLARLRTRLRTGDLEVPPIPEGEGVPTQVAALLAACLAVDPARRPTSRQIVQLLDSALHGRQSATDDEESPFRGLLAFGEEHTGTFFGREGELALFVERLRTEPTLPVVGPSGAGKSSFVFAGVLPRLREQAFWQVVHVRPGRDPFGALAGRLAAKASFSTAPVPAATLDFPDDTGSFSALDLPTEDRVRRSPEMIEQRLRDAPTALHLVLAELAEEQRSSVLLVVDQLEELYTLVPDEAERRAFMTALCTAADDPDEPIRVVFTVRDDFLGRLAETPAAADALARVALIRPLGREALRETLVGPLRSRGYVFDPPSLADEMVEEVADSPAALPLLQFAARLLWDRRDTRGRLLRREAYDAIGGVAGALARHADDVLAGLTEPQRLVARQILLRLVTAEGTRRTVPWREALDGLDPEHAEVTLERLVQSRLLAVREGADPGDREVELAHESLVRTWTRLRRWHADSREEVRVLAEMEEAARLWDRRGRRPTELWSGDTLQDAERSVRAAGIGLSERARGFLAAATELRDRARVRRLRLRWAGGVGLVAATAASMAVAWAFAGQAERAEQARAEALVSGAHAALASGDALSAQAKLRSALSLRDSLPARALWVRLREAPLVWSVETPFWPHGWALAPDDQHVAVASSDGALRVYDLRTGAVEGFRSDTSALSTAAVSPSGARHAAAAYEGQVRVWTAADREPIALPGVPKDTYPYHLDFLGEDVLQLYVYWPETFETAMVRWTLDAPAEPVIVPGTKGHGRMEVSPDRRWLVSGNPRGGEVTLFDLSGEAAPRSLGELDAGDRVGRLVFSGDGSLVAAVGRNVVLFQVRGTAAPARFEGLPNAVKAAGWLDDGRLVGLAADGQVRAWDAATGAVLTDARLPLDGDAGVNGGAVTRDGKLYVHREGGFALVDLDRLAEPVAVGGLEGVVSAVTVSPDGKVVASGGQDGLVRLRDAVTGDVLADLDGASGVVTELRWSPAGDLLAGVSGANEAVIWSSSGETLRVIPHEGDVKALAFAGPDELVTAEYAGWLHRWDVSALRDPARPDEVDRIASRRLDTNLFDVDVPRGGDLFVASDYYGKLHVGSLDGTGPVRVIEAHKRQCHSVAALPDGHRAVSMGFDNAARLWDLDTGELVREVAVEGTGGMGLSADGRSLLFASDAGAEVWDVETGAIRTLPWLPDGAGMASWAPDGSAIFFGDGAGTVRRARSSDGRLDWRTILADSEGIATHRGWVGEPPPWADRVLQADVADVEGETVCIGSTDAVEVVALAGACAERKGREVRVGERVVEGEWNRLQAQPDARVAALGDAEIAVLGPTGEVARRVPAPPGVTAARIDGEALWVGFADGGLSRLTASGVASALVLVAPPAHPVTVVEPGPAETLFAGYADGSVVLWDLRSGAALLERRFHGPPVALIPVTGGISVATEVGDHARIDLSVFEASACDVLREVEAAVPTLWEGDRIVVAAGSSGRCGDGPSGLSSR